MASKEAAAASVAVAAVALQGGLTGEEATAAASNAVVAAAGLEAPGVAPGSAGRRARVVMAVTRSSWL